MDGWCGGGIDVTFLFLYQHIMEQVDYIIYKFEPAAGKISSKFNPSLPIWRLTQVQPAAPDTDN
jgi:hypothetical protein